MLKKLLLCLFCLPSFLSLELLAEDYYVKENGTGDGNSWETAMSFDAIVAKIPTIPNNTNIHFAEGTYYVLNSVSSRLNIQSDVNLIGGYPANPQTSAVSQPELYKAIISGGNANPNTVLIYAETPNISITIKGIIFKDSRLEPIRFLYGHSLTVEDCIFENNGYATSQNQVSGINTQNLNECHINRTVFRNNISGNTLYFKRKVPIDYKTRISISNSLFENNFSSMYVGSVIYFLNDHMSAVDGDYQALVENCTFVNNGISNPDESYYASGLFSLERGGLTLKNNTFLDNYNHSGLGSTFITSESSKIEAVNNTIITNNNHSTGCAILLVESELTLLGNIFVDKNDRLAMVASNTNLGNISNITAKYNVFTDLKDYNYEPIYLDNIYQGDLDPSNQFIDLSTLSQMLEGNLLSGSFSATLKDNSGFTPTIAIAGEKSEDLRILPLFETPVTKDQRGITRSDPACIGAYEIACGFEADTLIIEKPTRLCRGETIELKISNIEASVNVQWLCDIDSVSIIDAGKNPAHFKIMAKRPEIPIQVSLTDICGNDTILKDTLYISGIGDVPPFTGLEANIYCKNAAPVELIPGIGGGIFTGDGITDNNKFNPSFVSGNTATIRYEIALGSGCPDFYEQTINLGAPDPSFDMQITALSAQDALCYGNNGSVQFTLTGGDGDFLYTINNGSETAATTGETLLNLPAGTYTITAWQKNDKCAGAVSANFSILQPDTLQASLDITHVSCDDGTNGAIQITPNGGTPTYSYTLKNTDSELTLKQTQAYFGNLPANSYRITVTDINNCSWSKDTIVGSLEIKNVSIKNQSCFGVDNGAVSLSYSSNTLGLNIVVEILDGTNTVLKSINSTAQTNNTINGLAPGTYDIRIRYADATPCVSETKTRQTFEIKAIEKLSAQIVQGSAVPQTCITNPNGAFEVLVNGWANTHTALLNNQTPKKTPATVNEQEAHFLLDNLSADTYYLHIQDECGTSIETEAQAIDGIEPYQFNIIDQKSHLDCDYSTDGFVELKITGGHVPTGIIHFVENKDTLYTFNPIPSDSVVRFDSLARGIYQIIYSTTQEGCPDNKIETKNITAPDGVNFAYQNLHVSCFGLEDGEISLLAYQGSTIPREKIRLNSEKAMKGFDGFIYEWQKCDNTAFNFIQQTIPLEDFWYSRYSDTIYNGVVGVEELPIGKYICEVTIENGNKNGFCYYNSDSIEILKPTYDSLEITNISVDAAANCKIEKRRVEITAKGGWKGYVFSVLTQTEYEETQNKDDENNSDETPGETGGGGLIKGYDDDDSEIIYDADNNTAKYTSKILLPGTYHVFVTDSLGCQAQETHQFTIDPVVKLSNIYPVDTLLCPRDSSGVVELFAEGGSAPYTYQIFYSKDSIETLNSNICDKLTKGIYSFVATESNKGCEGFNTFEIKDNKKPYSMLLQEVEDAKCHGQNNGKIKFLLTGGSVPYTFKIDGNKADATPENEVFWTISSISGGSQTQTLYAYDQNNCLKTLDFTIKEPDILQINYIKESEICPGSDKGRLVVQDVSGGTKPYNYSLSDKQFQTNTSLKAAAGTHDVFVKDANGCEASGSGTVRTKSGNGDKPDIDFLVSTWGYSSDIWAIIDISTNETVERDSISISFGDNDTMVYKIDTLLQTIGMENVLSNGAGKRIALIGIKKGITDTFPAQSETVLLSYTIKMTVYYADGCDYDVEKTVYVSPDSIEIYPNGKLPQKQADIISLTVVPNPIDKDGNYELIIEFANKVDFTVEAYNVAGAELGKTHFPADRIGEDGKVIISKQDLNIDITALSVFRVYTQTDAASVIVITKN